MSNPIESQLDQIGLKPKTMTTSSEHSTQDRESTKQKFRAILGRHNAIVFSFGAISILLALILGDQRVGLPLALFALTIVIDFVMILSDRVLNLSKEIRLLRKKVSDSFEAHSRSGENDEGT